MIHLLVAAAPAYNVAGADMNTTIGKAITIKGTIQADETITIAGTVTGDVMASDFDVTVEARRARRRRRHGAAESPCAASRPAG